MSRSNMEIEHLRMTPTTRMSICCFLLIPLYSELALLTDPLMGMLSYKMCRFM
jgi:hypothetical protein